MKINQSTRDNATTIVVFDENPVWREMIRLYLESDFYKVILLSDGSNIMQILQDRLDKISMVILDDDNKVGIARIILKKIKADTKLCNLPVLMVTANPRRIKLDECIRSGAYYYIAKPFSVVNLLSLTASAIKSYYLTQQINNQMFAMRENFQAIEQVTFNFRTREQARSICVFISEFADLTNCQEMGLLELMLNAIEHGNLSIGYEVKSELIRDNRLDEEINLRLTMPQFADRIAILEFRRFGHNYIFTISDEGDGFVWRPYLKLHPGSVSGLNGRGIALANQMVFSNINYWANGNVVEAIIASSEC